MRRESVNCIRYLLEELLPPVIRDSAAMRALFRMYWGGFVDELERFRASIHHVTGEQYADIYKRMPRIQEGTDNSRACIEQIRELLVGNKVCDVGCGTGFLVDALSKDRSRGTRSFTGIDFQIDPEIRARVSGATFIESGVESTPFADASFDTVVCTHVLEHVLDIRKAITELRRICARRLIVVVPLEREYRFTFNPHVHFFPYPHSFLRQIIPVPALAQHRVVGRDLVYWEDRDTDTRTA